MDTVNFLNKIKSLSFIERDLFLKNHQKDEFLSTSKVLSYLEPEKDWLQIATKCSENPNHEHYGKSPEKIIEIWNNKSKVGKDRGSNLEIYIHAKINGDYEACNDFRNLNSDDTNLIGKCDSFDDVYVKSISKVSHIGNEIWLTDSVIGTSVRLDSLFVNTNTKKLYVFDWKNNDNITEENRFNSYFADSPLMGVPVCDAIKMNFQVGVYKYIIEKYIKTLSESVEFAYLKDYEVVTFVLNLTKMSPKVITNKHINFNNQLIESVYEYARERHTIQLTKDMKVKEEIKDFSSFNKVNLDDNLVIVINGYAKSGKDTFVNLFKNNYLDLCVKKGINDVSFCNVSTIDNVNNALRVLGWNGEKTDEYRKIASELKKLSTEFNENPTEYVVDKIVSNKLTFCHIREWSEILKLKTWIDDINKNCDKNIQFLTLFVERKDVDYVENKVDNLVSEYKDYYNLHVHNNSTIDELNNVSKDVINYIFKD